MYTKLLQIFFASAFVSFSLFGQNGLEITTRINGNYDEQRSLNISVNDAGKELYVFEKTLIRHQSIPQIEVLSNKSMLLIHSLEGLIEIYDSKGSLVSKKEFYKLPPYNEQRILVDIFDSGFVLLISEVQKNNLYFFNNNGEEIFSKNVPDGLIFGLVSSNDAELIAYSLMRWKANNLESETVILDTKIDSEIMISNRFEKGTFDNEAMLFLGFTNNNTFMIDIPEKKLLFEKYLSDDKMYVDGIIKNDRAIFVKANTPKFIDKQWIYDGLEVIQKDITGNESVLYSATKNVNKVNLVKLQNKIEVELDNESVMIEVN